MPYAPALPKRQCWSGRSIVSSLRANVANRKPAARRGQRCNYGSGDFGLGRRNMVTMPSAVATYKENGRTIERKARLRLWIRLIRTSRFIEGVIRERLKTQFKIGRAH